MSRKRWSAFCLLPSAVGLLASGFSLLTPVYGADKKLTEDDRVEILRGLMAEYATAKTMLPRSKKPLPSLKESEQPDRSGRRKGVSRKPPP